MRRSALYRTVDLPADGQLDYYLLIDDACYDGGSLEVYGVEAVLSRAGRTPERRAFRGITPLGSQILPLLDRLSAAAVCPDELPLALETLLG